MAGTRAVVRIPGATWHESSVYGAQATMRRNSFYPFEIIDHFLRPPGIKEA